MELISESDLEDWDAAITKGEAVRLFTTMSFMYYLAAGDGSLMDEIAENIIYPDVNPEDVDTSSSSSSSSSDSSVTDVSPRATPTRMTSSVTCLFS